MSRRTDLKIRDLIRLPEIRTVVQLRDTEDPEESRRLVDHYVLTRETGTGLQVILRHLLRGEGSGFFLKGHFGSGKSHFLAYLTLILSENSHLKRFLKLYRESDLSQSLSLEPLQERRFAILPVSLVEFRSTLYLEDILLEALQERYGRLMPGLELSSSVQGRGELFDRVFAALNEAGYQGLIILVDELSEFLRSKPSLDRFNEDIRYLQFLGEAGKGRPLWVVAALQEYLEETGEIHQELFNKIRDRYPVRIELTAAHLKTLVREFLIQKDPSARPHITQLYGRLKSGFPGWKTSAAEFYDLYPVHPATIDVLEDLKPLFSKTRGLVDFIHYQIKGDADRAIAGLMDQSYDSLLCPDRIFDHFLDRMRNLIETVPYVETVFASYQKQAPQLFESPQDQIFALRLLRILILQAVSPVRRSFTTRQLTEMLLERLTDLDPALNYQYTFDIAQVLARKGGFVVAGPGNGDLGERTFHIELEADVHGILARKLDYKKEVLRGLAGQIPSQLFRHLTAHSAFFGGVGWGGREMVVADWQNTRRSGQLWTDPTSSEGETPAPPEEPEFRLVILSPGERPDLELKGASGCPVGVLVPAKLEEPEICLEALALIHLRQELAADESTQGLRIRELLESELARALSLVEPIFSRAYRTASLLTPQGELVWEFADSGRDLRSLIQEAASHLLDFRYPKHYLIAPQQNFYPAQALDELASFFQSMSPENFEKLRWGRTILDGFLLPTGLIKRRRNEYAFCSGVEQSAPLKKLLERVERGCSAWEAKSWMAESELGMSELQFRAFLLATLYGGFVQAVRNDRKVGLSQLRADRLMELEKLVPGETISAETAAFLSRLELVPKHLRKGTLSYSESQQCWGHLVEQVREVESRLEELEALLSRYGEYRTFALLKQEELGAVLEAARELRQSVRTSYAPIEGLEHFRRHSADPQALNAAVQSLRDCHTFLLESFAAYSFIAGYAEQAEPLIPEDGSYAVIREGLTEIWAQLSGWSPLAAPDRFQALRQRWDAWQLGYARQYQSDHQAFYESGQFEQWEDLLKGKELALLSRLERLNGFLPERPVSLIRQDLTDRRAQRCRRPVFEELAQRPLCSCDFRLGQEVEGASPAEIKTSIEQQLASFIVQVGNPRFQEHLDRFIFHLQRKGGTDSGSDFLSTARALKDVSSLSSLLELEAGLSSTFLERFNGFEPGRRAFAVKSFRAFRRRLGNQARTRKKLLEEFSQWLAEDLNDPDEPILLVDQEPEEQAPERDEVGVALAKFAPGLLEDRQRLSGEEFLFRLLSSDLAVRFSLSSEQARARLSLLPGDSALVREYAKLAERLPAEGRIWQARNDFEERLGGPGYEALGLLPDASQELARLIAGETRFIGLVQEAALRLAKKLLFSDAGSASRIARILHEEWRGPDFELDRKEKEECRGLLESLCRLVEAEKSLSSHSQKPLSRELFEKEFTHSACLLPYLLDRFQISVQQLDASGSLDFSRRRQDINGRLAEFQEAFSVCLGKENETDIPRVAGILASELPEMADRLRSDSVVFLFVDALSWPLWKLLAEELKHKLSPRLKIIEQRVAYAHLPSNTREQVETWLQLQALHSASVRQLKKGFSGTARQSLPAATLHKIDWIDEKVHTSRDSPFSLYREILDQLVPQLVSFAERLPRHTLLVLFADHGFTENPAFQPHNKYAQPRYRHGGSSPLEVVVPVVFFFAS